MAVQIDSIEQNRDLPFLGTVTLDNDVVHVGTADVDDSVQIRIELLFEDGVGGSDTCQIWYDINGFNCGDVDHLMPVDVDDVVFIINPVLVSGSPPDPYRMGHVDCSSAIDIDDIAYSVNYVVA